MKCEFCQADIPEGVGITHDGHNFCNSLHRMSWENARHSVDLTKNTTSHKSNSKRWALILTALFAAVGAVIGSRLASGLFGSTESIDKTLVQMASELNKSCPVMVDKFTRWDNTVAGANKTIFYNYTVLESAENQANIDQVREYLRPRLVNNVKTNADMKFFRDNEVTLVYRYTDKEGKEFLRLTVAPDDYR